MTYGRLINSLRRASLMIIDQDVWHVCRKGIRSEAALDQPLRYCLGLEDAPDQATE